MSDTVADERGANSIDCEATKSLRHGLVVAECLSPRLEHRLAARAAADRRPRAAADRRQKSHRQSSRHQHPSPTVGFWLKQTVVGDLGASGKPLCCFLPGVCDLANKPRRGKLARSWVQKQLKMLNTQIPTKFAKQNIPTSPHQPHQPHSSRSHHSPSRLPGSPMCNGNPEPTTASWTTSQRNLIL